MTAGGEVCVRADGQVRAESDEMFGQDVRATELLELVGRIGAHATNSTNVPELLGYTTAAVATAAGAAAGHVYRLDSGAMEAASESWWVAEVGDHHTDLTALMEASERLSFRAGIGLPGQTLGRAEPVWFADLAAATTFVRREAARACGLNAAFAFPVLIGRRVVAVLEFFAEAPQLENQQLLRTCGVIGQIVGQVVDRIEAHHDQWESQAHAQMILDNAGDAFIAIAGDGAVIGWNREAERMFGYSAAEAVGRPMAELIMPAEYRADHDAGIERYMANGHGRVAHQYVELEALRKGGARFPIEIAFWGMSHQGRWQFYSFVRDISDRRARDAELRRRATHDQLTDLPNRASALERLDIALARRSAAGGDIWVLLMDLDRFRVTRERLGHESADDVLVLVADRVRLAVGDDGWVARVGDDEFAIVCEHVHSVDTVLAIGRRVRDCLRAPIELTEDRVAVDASIGVVMAAAVADTADSLLSDATAGLVVGRSAMRGQIKVFDAPMRRAIHERLAIERDLATAIAGDQLRLHYQPVVDLANGGIVGVEALIRWQHPERGLLAPGAFIDVAEESGLIVPMGNWVAAEACRQAAAWQQAGVSRFSLAINLSARQFGQSGLVPAISGAVASAGLDMTRMALVLEVTESLLMNDPASAARTLALLCDRGFRISIDDFGTGYSSLAYLKRFPVDTVKIDRSFVTDIDTDTRDRAIVGAVTSLGHALGLAVLAEGIETAAQRNRLLDLGCDFAQGYFFGRPMPAADITRLIQLP